MCILVTLCVTYVYSIQISGLRSHAKLSTREPKPLHVISSAILMHLSFGNEIYIYVSSECGLQLIQVPEAQPSQ